MVRERTHAGRLCRKVPRDDVAVERSGTAVLKVALEATEVEHPTGGLVVHDRAERDGVAISGREQADTETVSHDEAVANVKHARVEGESGAITRHQRPVHIEVAIGHADRGTRISFEHGARDRDRAVHGTDTGICVHSQRDVMERDLRSAERTPDPRPSIGRRSGSLGTEELDSLQLRIRTHDRDDRSVRASGQNGTGRPTANERPLARHGDGGRTRVRPRVDQDVLLRRSDAQCSRRRVARRCARAVRCRRAVRDHVGNVILAGTRPARADATRAVSVRFAGDARTHRRADRCAERTVIHSRATLYTPASDAEHLFRRLPEAGHSASSVQASAQRPSSVFTQYGAVTSHSALLAQGSSTQRFPRQSNPSSQTVPTGRPTFVQSAASVRHRIAVR